MFLTKVLINFLSKRLLPPLPSPFGCRAISAQVENGNYVIVQENANNENSMKFPAVWLRDNCQCTECFHPSSQSRRIKWDNFDTKVKVQQIATNSVENVVTIKWSDQHTSTYNVKWLKEREFSAERRAKYLNNFYRPKPIHWKGEDFLKIVQSFRFDDVMNNDEALRIWLETLAVRGVAIINESPLDKGVVRRLVERVGFIRRTTYGEEFIVQSKPGAKNYAYLSDPLPLHTDLPYYEYKPGVNILHCMVQTESKGGNSLILDAFHIADRMRDEFPDYYKVLTETLVNWNDIGSEDGKEFHNIWRAPVICLNCEGDYTRINHSIAQRDSQFSVHIQDVIPWYDAYSKFVKLATDDACAFKMQPGEILTFSNIRLLHGRTGFDDTEGNVRCIIGAYIDWDLIYSKLRILK